MVVESMLLRMLWSMVWQANWFRSAWAKAGAPDWTTAEPTLNSPFLHSAFAISLSDSNLRQGPADEGRRPRMRAGKGKCASQRGNRKRVGRRTSDSRRSLQPLDGCRKVT